MKNSLVRFYPYIFIIAVWFVFSFPFFLQGKVPFASTFQVNFYSPWSSYNEFAGPVKNGAQPDIITQIYPWRIFSIDELRHGRIPLWNPYSFSGTPHLANYQSAVFAPGNLFFLLPISNIDAWSLIVLFQPLLAGIGVYLFAKSLKMSSLGSLISAVSFMFCGFITTWMGYATLGYAILFLPYALFTIEKYLQKKAFIYLPILSISIAFSLLSGHFQTSFYLLLFIVAYSIFRLFPLINNRKTIPIISFITAGVLLAMPQILPTVELYFLSVRSGIFKPDEVIPWSYLPTFFSPDFFGNPVTRNNWFGHYAEWNGYIGATSLSLAIHAIFNFRKKEILFFLIAAIITLLLAFDTPLINLLVALKLPILSTSAAGRIIVLTSFSLSILAGFGFEKLKDVSYESTKKILIWGMIVLAIFFFLFFYSSQLAGFEKTLIARKNLILPFVLVIGVLGSALELAIIRHKKLFTIFSILILLLVSVDMLRFAKKWQPFDPKDLVFKDVKTTDFYKNQNTSKRFLGDFTAENSVYYHLQSLGGYDPLYPASYGEFIMYAGSGKEDKPERSVVNFPKDGVNTPKALDYLGVSYIIEKNSDEGQVWGFPFYRYPASQFKLIYNDDKVKVYKNTQAYPRAFIVYNTVYTKKSETLKEVFAQDLLKVAVVNEKMGNFQKTSTGSAKITEYLPGKVTIEAESTSKGLLELTDNYYPGWKVRVNGKEQKLLEINYTFRGVQIPGGKSKVIMEYSPKSFLYGIYLSLVGLLIIATAYVLRNLKKI